MKWVWEEVEEGKCDKIILYKNNVCVYKGRRHTQLNIFIAQASKMFYK